MERLTLSGSGWTFAGFHGEEWRRLGAMHRETRAGGWQPASVPGSVHWGLLKAGEIPDPYWERNSLLVEWVHGRHWVYKRDLSVPEGWADKRVWLVFDGVDYEAEFFLDGVSLGSHASLFEPARFDVTALVRPGESHHLAVILRAAPDEPPQLGRTSEVRTFKPRVGYWWDFATRLVHLGIWQEVRLEADSGVRLEDVWVRAVPVLEYHPATVHVSTRLENAAGGWALVETTVLDPLGREADRVLTSHELEPGRVSVEHDLVLSQPALWWPNGLGEQPLYRCQVTVRELSGVVDIREVTFGVRRLTLEPNPWPPPGALPGLEPPRPYTFTVNGRPMFVKGWNWTPVDLMYGRPDLAERYAQLIELARDSGANLIRVNGVGLIERELFYDLCDRAGLLVWQEFIQTSSGTENLPPSGPDFLALAEREARAIIPQRRNHPSLALWCGGNELTDLEKRPATSAMPVLGLLERLVNELDPLRPFLPTSPSGPVYDLDDEVALKRPGELHDVHGPWHYRGPVETYIPFNRSTALFHSEFGINGSVAASSLDRFIAPEHQWPPDATNPNWEHHGAWWMHAHRVREVFGEVSGIAEYWPLSQFLQAEGLRYSIEANRRRWPVCSGAMIWQLNEPWPNAHCTTAVDYYLRPKMAYYWTTKAFAPLAASLRYEGQVLADGVLRGSLFVVADEPFTGHLRVTVTDPTGREWHREERPASGVGVSELGVLEWALPEDGPDVVICELKLVNGRGWVLHSNPYLFSRAAGPIFASLRAVPRATLELRREENRVVLENHGPGYAFFPAIDLDDPRWYWRLSDNFPLIAPGSTFEADLDLTPRLERADTDFPHGRPGPDGAPVVRVTGWNLDPLELIWDV